MLVWAGAEFWEAGTGPALGKGSSRSQGPACPQHSRGCPCLEGQGVLELSHGCAQLELGVGNNSTEVHLGLLAALLQHSVSWFQDWLDHLQTQEGGITEQSPEGQAEKGIFWPPRSASQRD